LEKSKWIDSDQSQTAVDSVPVHHDYDSNVTDESRLHHGKQNEPKISTLLGIKID
jgi:hypothetical protein